MSVCSHCGAKFDSDSDSDSESEIETKTKTRHRDQPKNPSNAYIWYSRTIRPLVLAANPEMKNPAIVATIAKQWKEMSEDDRSDYVFMAVKDKQRYDAEMKIYRGT